MNTILDFLRKLTDTSDWPPRWHCGNWTEFHGWLYIISDITIWAAYFAIPSIIFYYLRKKQNLDFKAVYWLFIGFITLCGLTHLIDATIFWIPFYRLSAFTRFLTALVSVGTVYSLVKMVPDVLQLKSHKEMEEANNKLAQKNNELNDLTYRLTQKNKQLDDFAHITSHNLRAPAGNIISLLEVYDTVDSQGEKQDILNMLRQTAHELNTTLNELMEVLRVTDTQDVPHQTMSIDDALSHVKILLQADILATNAAIISNFDKMPTVHYPKMYLESILLNLLSNAIKYRSSERELKVEIHAFFNSSGEPCLSVCDNGLGIDLKKHGNNLFRLHKTFHKHAQARGVGLYLVKQQVEMLGGKILIDSEENKGACFTVVFVTREAMNTPKL